MGPTSSLCEPFNNIIEIGDYQSLGKTGRSDDFMTKSRSSKSGSDNVC